MIEQEGGNGRDGRAIMDARFLRPEKLPLLPGTSPFRMKGHVYRGVLDHLETMVPGGAQAVRSELRDPDLNEFFGQSFLPSGWYDILPALPLIVTASRIMGAPFLNVARDVARAQAHRDIHGIYRFVLKLTSADMVIARMARATSQYFDFGTSELKAVGRGHAYFERTGVPGPIAAFYCGLTEGFVSVALELSGAKDVKVRPGRPTRDGSRAGVETVMIPFDIKWQV